MKKIALLALILIVFAKVNAQKNDPVVMTIAGEEVCMSEFEKVYKKNMHQAQNTDDKSLDEYLDLYVNYRLKVKEAEALGYDTVSSLLEELAGYRDQLAQPYLADKNVTDHIIEEAYERMKHDVRVSHILVLVDENALPKDTLAAYKKMEDIVKEINGGLDFNEAALKYSEDPSAKGMPARGARPAMPGNRGDLGYFTVFQMIYPFETMAYTTPVGEVSSIIRTKYGYHVLKVSDKRRARGQVLTAHIMLHVDENWDEKRKGNARAKIMEIHDRITKGEDFASLAQRFSDDKNSGEKGGVLPWFGTGRMVPEFEEQAFSLKSKGDFSAPFRTKYGWHIVQLVDKKEIGAFDEVKYEIKRRVERDARAQLSKKAVINRLKTEYKYKKKKKALKTFYQIVDSTVLKGKWEPSEGANLQKFLFGFAGQKFYQYDFSNYIVKHQAVRSNISIPSYVNKLYDQFVEDQIVAYEKAQLESKYPDFADLMKEYRDGILLFELTNDMVWSKGINDTVGLEQFYHEHKDNYMWGERVEAVVYMCANEDVAKKVRQYLEQGRSKEEIEVLINVDSQLNVTVEQGKFAEGDHPLIDEMVAKKVGLSHNIHVDNSVALVQVKALLPNAPKTLSEARGLITSDYQKYLEEKWMNELKEKYPVQLNKEVLSEIK